MTMESFFKINDLRTHFYTDRGRLTAVDGISLNVKKGEILGVLGESGCGKSVSFQSVMRLHDEKYNTDYEGEIIFKGKDLLKLPFKKMQSIRGKEISMIFQDPSNSLNPVYTIGYQIAESIMIHQNISKNKAYKKAVNMLRKTGIPMPEKRISEYPHQLSGGMQQRAMISMALASNPEILIADEPTTALDVTIQAQILDIIKELNSEFNMTVIFITHDLGVVAEICDRVAIMYLGQIVEESKTEHLFNYPLHPYTQGLIKSIPQLDSDRSEKLYTIEGNVPSIDNIPKGCRFAPRCPYASDLCFEKEPILETYNNQKVRCWHVDKINKQGVESYANSEKIR